MAHEDTNAKLARAVEALTLIARSGGSIEQYQAKAALKDIGDPGRWLIERDAVVRAKMNQEEQRG